MNIFAVHQDPTLAADSLCNIHTRSQLRESGQMLSTALRCRHGVRGTVIFFRKNGSVEEDRPIITELEEYSGMRRTEARIYWDAYVNHPCTRWARTSWANYIWLYKHAQRLAEIYYERSGKCHGTWDKLGLPLHPNSGRAADLRFGLSQKESDRLWNGDYLDEITPFALAMDDDCIEPGAPDVRHEKSVISYRRYYYLKKRHVWEDDYEGRKVPAWIRQPGLKIRRTI